MPGLNDDEAPDLLAWAVENEYELRFIEQMPLDAQHGWKRDGMITAGDILESLRTRFTLTEEGSEERGSAPAERWVVDGGPATVGVIASVTRPFCGACDRTRLTADGQIRTCLFATEESDLRAALRSGAPDEEIARLWKVAMWGKKAGPASTTRASCSPTARCRRSAADPSRQPPSPTAPSDPEGSQWLRPLRALGRFPLVELDDVLEEAADPQELGQMLAVLLARQPGLAALGGVQLRVVPRQDPDGRLAAGLGGTGGCVGGGDVVQKCV